MLQRWRQHNGVCASFAASACFLLTMALVAATGGGVSAAATTTSSVPKPSAPLSAPKTSVAQDGQFLTEVTEADPAAGRL